MLRIAAHHEDLFYFLILRSSVRRVSKDVVREALLCDAPHHEDVVLFLILRSAVRRVSKDVVRDALLRNAPHHEVIIDDWLSPTA
jgi:hypothetical protein